jgi:hypothetical protein
MLTRRGFLVWAAGAVPVAIFVRAAHAASIAHLAAAPETLDALGEAILPSELGRAERARVVAGFRRWMDGYRENAELLHAYGGSRLRLTGATPATRWGKQLDELDAATRASDGKAFSALPVGRRQAVVRPLLAAERAGMPASPDGATHVAAGLLAFFYSSALATDLCYEVAIGKNQCRPLAQSSRRPLARSASSSGRVLSIRSDVETGS